MSEGGQSGWVGSVRYVTGLIGSGQKKMDPWTTVLA